MSDKEIGLLILAIILIISGIFMMGIGTGTKDYRDHTKTEFCISLLGHDAKPIYTDRGYFCTKQDGNTQQRIQITNMDYKWLVVKRVD